MQHDNRTKTDPRVPGHVPLQLLTGRPAHRRDGVDPLLVGVSALMDPPLGVVLGGVLVQPE